MNYYTNQQVDERLDSASASEAIRRAYLQLHHGDAAVQVRGRIAVPEAKFSSMSAILSAERVAATKMYTTLDGRFRFFIALFSTVDGALLAMLEGDAITRVRTAATTALAARHLARPSSRSLGVFGSGMQAREHADALAQGFDFHEAFIRSTDDTTANEMAKHLRDRYGIRATLTDARHAAAADVVVLATRASDPVIEGSWLAPGAFVASIGATRPDQRELDDASVEAASGIVVDWSGQALFETGDLLLPPRALIDGKTITDLSAVIAANTQRPDDAADVVLYKATGMALQDAAVAHLAYRRLIGR